MSIRNVRLGHRDVQYPSSQLGELRASNDLLDNVPALQTRLQEDGYLLLRNFIARETVMQARYTLLNHMDAQGVLLPGEPVFEGVMPKDGKGVKLMGNKGITHQPDVLAVLEADVLFSFYERLFGEPALTFNYKWMRAVGNEKYTSAHCDIVYMGRGSKKVITTWIPMGDATVEHGTLAVCVGSHREPGFAKIHQTYGQMDVDRDRIDGWFTEDPMEIVEKFGGCWQTTDFYAGDILLFGMYTMHASTTNLTNRFRLSADVRYQPATAPVDERWVGDNHTGHTVFGQVPLRSMAEVRAEWGI